MHVIRLMVLASVLSGCFYTDPINQRPSIAIHQVGSGAVTRGAQHVAFSAVSSDPDGDTVALSWRAYACQGTMCDATEFQSGTDTVFDLVEIPLANAALESYDTLEIRLEGRDALGATAKPSQTLDIHLGDAAPKITMRAGRPSVVVNEPVAIYALVTDLDDPVAGPESHYAPPVWNVTAPPTTQDWTLDDLQVPGTDSTHLQLGKTFTPKATGDWTIQLTATDPMLAQTVQDLNLHVDADQLPCVSQWVPAATTDPGTSLQLTDPTLFEVLVVTDDLDPYPSVPNDPVLGTTEFYWSIVPPGGGRQDLPNVSGNAVALDPASYTPGDLVELRVEIEDRNHRAVTCPDGDLTCSMTVNPNCSQRLTWRVVVR
jgi:hypothetical protein